MGCRVRFTLLVRMREDLQPYCEITYFVAEHTGHVGADTLAQHRRQARLSDAACEYVAQCLNFGLSTAEILARNVRRLEREWLQFPGMAASGVVRVRLTKHTSHVQPHHTKTCIVSLVADAQIHGWFIVHAGLHDLVHSPS